MALPALRRCEYSLDAGDWIPVEAADGVIDSLREKFALDLANLKPGEHLLASAPRIAPTTRASPRCC